MKKFNLYWDGKFISAYSPNSEDLLSNMQMMNILSDEFVKSVLDLEVGESATDDDGDRWERVE